MYIMMCVYYIIYLYISLLFQQVHLLQVRSLRPNSQRSSSLWPSRMRERNVIIAEQTKRASRRTGSDTDTTRNEGPRGRGGRDSHTHSYPPSQTPHTAAKTVGVAAIVLVVGAREMFTTVHTAMLLEQSVLRSSNITAERERNALVTAEMMRVTDEMKWDGLREKGGGAQAKSDDGFGRKITPKDGGVDHPLKRNRHNLLGSARERDGCVRECWGARVGGGKETGTKIYFIRREGGIG